jgi:hypothetical protein
LELLERRGVYSKTYCLNEDKEMYRIIRITQFRDYDTDSLSKANVKVKDLNLKRNYPKSDEFKIVEI